MKFWELQVAIFAIPADMGEFAQYAWFFIAYTLLNAVFYTANNIAYSAWEKLQRRKNWDYKEEEECRQKAEFLNMEIM